LGTLADIGVRRSKSNKPLDLGILVIWPEVQVKPIFARLGLWHRNEQKSRKAIFAWSYLELVGIVVDRDPAERFLPPAAKRYGIFRVNVYLLPLETHVLSIEGTAGIFGFSSPERRCSTRPERRSVRNRSK
jgi:hypothetical protein